MGVSAGWHIRQRVRALSPSPPQLVHNCAAKITPGRAIWRKLCPFLPLSERRLAAGCGAPFGRCFSSTSQWAGMQWDTTAVSAERSCCVLCNGLTMPLAACPQPLSEAPLFKTPAQASKGMVCTNHPIASAAGVEMFAVVSRELRQRRCRHRSADCLPRELSFGLPRAEMPLMPPSPLSSV